MVSKSKPLTPYMLFCEDHRKKDKDITVKELGTVWQKLTDNKKKNYVKSYQEAKDRYDKYLESIYGPEPLTYKPTDKPVEFTQVRIRSVLGSKKEIMAMNNNIYPGLIKVMVDYIRNFSKNFSRILDLPLRNQ